MSTNRDCGLGIGIFVSAAAATLVAGMLYRWEASTPAVPDAVEPNGPVVVRDTDTHGLAIDLEREPAGPLPSPDRRLVPQELADGEEGSQERAGESRDERDPGAELEALRREVAALEHRLAQCQDSPYGRLLSSGELASATLEEKRAVRGWLEDCPIMLLPGEGLWVLDWVRSGYRDDPCLFFGRERLIRELGAEKALEMCEQ